MHCIGAEFCPAWLDESMILQLYIPYHVFTVDCTYPGTEHDGHDQRLDL